MTREEFSGMLVECRKEAGASNLDMVLALQMLPKDITKLEKATHNFFLLKGIEYLAALKYCIRVTNDYSDRKIRSHEDAIEWLKLLKSDVSNVLLAQISGINRSTISSILLGNTKMKIDVFLKLANFYNCNITIEKYE